MKAKEIEHLLNEEGYSCRLFGNPDVEVEGFADPYDYRDGSVIWLGDIKYLTLPPEQYERVALLMCKKGMAGKELFPNVLICEDPRNAFMRLLEVEAGKKEKKSLCGIDPNAIVDESTQIGEDVYIGPGAVVGPDVILGDRTQIMPNVFIEHTTTGEDCIIFPGCVIGVAAHGYRKEKRMTMELHIGRVVLGDRVNVLSSSVVERGTVSNTVIGNDTKIANMTNIGHNTKVGERCQINGGKLHGGVLVGDDTEIICSFVANRIKIGSNVKIGLNSTVVRDIPNNSIAFGSPARVRGDYQNGIS